MCFLLFFLGLLLVFRLKLEALKCLHMDFSPQIIEANKASFVKINVLMDN